MFQVILSIGTAFLEILFLDGAVVGWPSLQFVLQKEGYFGYLCPNSTFSPRKANLTSTVFSELDTLDVLAENSILDTNPTNVTTDPSRKLICDEQDASFNLVFSMSHATLFFGAFPVGWMFDYLASTWTYRCIASSCFTLSFLLLTVSEPATSALLYPSMILMALSGYALLASNYQLANLGKSARNPIITATNGVMDSAVVPFLLIKKGYDFGTKLNTIFLIFTLLTLFIWVRTFLLMPRKVIYYPIKIYPVLFGWKEWNCFKKSEVFRVTNDLDTVTGKLSACEKCEDNNHVKDPAVKSRISFLACLKKRLLWSSIFHLNLLKLRLSIYLGTVLQWLEGLGQSEESISKYIDDFLIILIFAVFASPLNGLLVDVVTNYEKSRKKSKKVSELKGSLASMIASSFLGILMSVMVLIPSIYGSFLLYFLLASFAFGGAVTFIMVHFPSEHLGKLVGLQFSFAGVAILFQFILYKIAAAVDPTFYYTNIGMLVVCVLTLIHPVLIWFESRKHTS